MEGDLPPSPITGYPQIAVTEVALRKAKAQEKPYKIASGNGLYLLVNPTGSERQRFSRSCRKGVDDLPSKEILSGGLPGNRVWPVGLLLHATRTSASRAFAPGRNGQD